MSLILIEAITLLLAVFMIYMGVVEVITLISNIKSGEF